MSSQWTVLFYRTIDEKCPVQEFLDGLKDKQRAKALAWIGLLQDHGVNLHRPFADTLEDGIRELRMKITGDQIRILYFFCLRSYIVLTHHFVKKTDKVPLKEIKTAKKFREDFLKRFRDIDLLGGYK